jgi:hypothetical protein
MEWNGTRGVFRERIAYWRPYIAALRYVTTAFTQLRVDPTVDPRSLLEDAGMPTVGTDNPVVTGTRELWASFGLGDPDFTVPLARWFTVNGPHCVAENLARVGSQDALKWLAYHVTNTWIPLGGIYVALASDGRRVQTVLHMGGIDQPGGMGIMPENSLRNVLVAQLLAQATKPSPDQLIACSNCGNCITVRSADPSLSGSKSGNGLRGIAKPSGPQMRDDRPHCPRASGGTVEHASPDSSEHDVRIGVRITRDGL